jgi:hypothetical protein
MTHIYIPYSKAVSCDDRVQRRATKLLQELRERTYKERMRFLDLQSLQYRRYRGDLIQTFKLFNS